jgi:hypothetical protein
MMLDEMIVDDNHFIGVTVDTGIITSAMRFPQAMLGFHRQMINKTYFNAY